MPGQNAPVPSPAPAASSSTQAVVTSSSTTKPALTLEQQHITAVEGIVPTLQ